MKNTDKNTKLLKSLAIIFAIALLCGSFSLSLSAVGRGDITPLASSISANYIVLDSDDIFKSIVVKNDTNVTTKTYADGVSSVNMKPSKVTSDPYVTLDVNVNADTYKFITVMLKTGVVGVPFHISYSKSNGNNAKYGLSVYNNYSQKTDWQFVSFDMSNISGWNGSIKSLKLDYFNDYTFDPAIQGTEFDIAYIIIAKNEDEAYNAGKSILGINEDNSSFVYNNFKSTDLDKNFSGLHGKTTININSVDGTNNLIFTANEETNDSYVDWNYNNYCDQFGLNKAKTTDVDYVFIKYRFIGGDPNATHGFNIYYVIGDQKGYDGHYCTGSASYKVTNNNEWQTIIIKMNSGEKNWNVNENGEVINRLRLDWCADASGGDVFEISEIKFVKVNNDISIDDIYSALNYIRSSATSMEEETTETETETKTETTDYLPDFDENTTETETLPDFGEDTTESDTLPDFGEDTTESDTLPDFDEDTTETETLPDFGEDTTESESDSQSESESDDESMSESESESITESDTESNINTETESNDDSIDESTSETEDQTETDDPEETLDDNIDPPENTENDETSTDTSPASTGSQMPFYIACGTMGVMSLGSIGTVIFIRIRVKLFI